MRCLLSFGFFVMLHSAAVAAEPPSDTEVFGFIRNIQMKYAAVEKEDFTAAKRQYRTIIAEMARGLNLAEMTPYQAVLIGPLLDTGDLDADQKRSLNQSLTRAAADRENGAPALLLLHSLNFWDDTQRTYLARFFEHPQLTATMNGWFCADAINSFGLGPEEMRRFGKDIERAVLSINPNNLGAAPGRASVSRLLESLDHPDIAAEMRDCRRRIHEHLLKIARSQLSKLAPCGGGSVEPHKSSIRGAIDLVEYLEGPASRLELIDRPAPELVFRWQRGPNAPLAGLADLKGKVVLLDFWATWCGPCVATFPQIRELQKRYRDKDVVIVGVTSIQGFHVPVGGGTKMLDDDPDAEMALMEAYMTANDVTWNVAFSTQSVLDPRFNVLGLPHVTIIDARGRVRHNGLHPSETSVEAYTKIIDALLAESR